MTTTEYKYLEADIQNFKRWIPIVEPKVLFDFLSCALKESGYSVLNFVEHHFPVKGYTCLWLLAESHLAVHTFPDDNITYLELSGCNKEKTNNFIQIINRWEEEIKS